jgi:hypothetical protein
MLTTEINKCIKYKLQNENGHCYGALNRKKADKLYVTQKPFKEKGDFHKKNIEQKKKGKTKILCIILLLSASNLS